MKRLWFCIAVVSVCAAAQAQVRGRHIRVENPTGWMMDWRQIEVYSGGENIVRNHGEMFTGTVWPDHNVKTRDGREMTDGRCDPRQRGVVFVDRFDDSTGEKGMNPWFEVDLGREVEIERIVLCGSRWPGRIYLDKGHRVVTVLGTDRRVLWAEKFDYYDGKRCKGGVFTFVPKPGQKNPAIGREIKVNAGPWTPMSWLLNADEVPPVPDAADRMRRFAKRSSPAEVKALADRFFLLLDHRIPELEEAHRLHAGGKHQAALDAWKVYWFAKMRRVNLHWAFRGDYWTYPTQGDDLLNGIGVTIADTSARAIRFVPGQIQWINLPARSDRGFGNAMRDAQRKAEVNRMARPLLDAYKAEPKAAYIRRWAEIMDDWSMNFFRDAGRCPYEVENLFTFNPGLMWQRMMEDLSDLAVKHPQVIERVPSTTLARVQLVCLERYTTAWWRQARETVFNHLNGGICLYYQIGYYIDEFHPGQRARVEFRQAFERFMTLGTERDGSLTEIGDEGHQEIPIQQGSFLVDYERRKLPWFTPGWRNRAYEWYDNLYKYMFRHLAPGGYEHRFAVDYRPMRWTSTYKQYQHDRLWLPRLPDRDKEVFTPEVRRMLDAWGHVSAGRPVVTDPAFKDVVEARQRSHDAVRKFLGDDKPGKPHINSDWMPYTGAYYFRGGWNENDAFLGMMACTSHGGSQAPQWPYGMIYHYDYDFPLVAARPVHVDGLQPQQLFGRMNCFQPGTKTMALTQSVDEPAPLRWISTDRFDFGEADFRGGYQNYPGFEGDWSGPDLRQRDAGRFVNPVRTIRQVFQLRRSRLFIVVDASRTPGEAAHEFSIPTIFSLSSRKRGASRPFHRADQLRIDEKNHLLRSANPDGPSVALHQFADRPVQYRRGRDARLDDRKYARRVGGQVAIADQRVNVALKGNAFRMVSLISSMPLGARERVSGVEPLNGDGVVGFRARLVDGGQLRFQSADMAAADLDCGAGKAKAQALLVVTDGTETRGMVLGAASLSIHGRDVRLANPDAQFVIAGGKLAVEDILRPIDPVRFLPGRNTFADSETVTMVSRTPNVEIRYTTDGTPPTRKSRRYTGPIRIGETTEFAARAYRLGADGKPMTAEEFEVNGTKFTVPSYGWFYKRPMKPAVGAAGLEPGLLAQRVEGPWWKLYASAHWLPAVRTDKVAREMAGLQKPGPEPYAMRYKGYLRVPRDGVYTFHAPHEFVNMDAAASYDLRLYVDGEEWYLTQWRHGRGTWSVPLKAGLHKFEVDFADARTDPWRRSGIWRYYPRPWAVYKGAPTNIALTGPGIGRPARIPRAWYHREAR